MRHSHAWSDIITVHPPFIYRSCQGELENNLDYQSPKTSYSSRLSLGTSASASSPNPAT
jgi:hypothetical protein